MTHNPSLAKDETDKPTRKTKIRAWVDALRLRTLPLTPAGVFIAAGIASYYNAFDVITFVLMFFVAILLQTISNFADEYGDLEKGVDDENRLGPIRGLQRGDITPTEMKRAIILTVILAELVGLSLILYSFSLSAIAPIIIFFVLGNLAIWAAIRYTMGERAYGYYGFGDLASFLFFGIFAVVGGVFLYTHTLIWTTFIPAVALGLPVVAVLHFNNMRDYDNDFKKGKRTVANMLGDPAMRVYLTCILSVSILLFIAYPVILKITNPLAYIYVVLLIPYILIIKKTWKVKSFVEFDKLLKPTSITTAVLALVFAISIGLIA